LTPRTIVGAPNDFVNREFVTQVTVENKVEDASPTIEHLHPQNPQNKKSEFKQIHAIGNLAVIESYLNKRYGNLLFSGKKEAYENSMYRTHRDATEDFKEDDSKNRSDRIKNCLNHFVEEGVLGDTHYKQ